MVNFNIRPTRGIAPPVGRAALELVQFPLYSAVSLAAAAVPSQISFFNYALGQNVTSSGTAAIQATRFHTNMETANFLSAPKVFTVHQIRIVVGQASYNVSPAVEDTTPASTVSSSPLFDDLLKLQSMAFRFAVGPKDYVQAPLWSIAANTGLGGTSSSAIASNNGTALSVNTNTPYLCGKSWSIKTWPVLIANQQSFSAELTNSFVKTDLSVSAIRLVWCVLEGVLGREVS